MTQRIARWRDPLANGLGIVIPAVLGVALTPFLLDRMGAAMFGVFSIQLAVLTILSVNDFGISRAVVLVAIARGGADRAGPRARAAGAGLHLAATLGLGLLLLLGPAGLAWLALTASGDVTVSSVLVLMSACLSLLILPLRANMEIERRFVALNLLRGIGSGLLFAAPAAALLAHVSLTAAATAILATRVLLLAAFVVRAGVPLGPGFRRATRAFVARLARLRPPELHRDILRRAGWLGASGAAAMLLGYIDRFVVGALAGPVAVAAYAVSSQLASYLWLVIGAFTNAETPRVAAQWDADRRAVRPGGLAFLTAIAFAVSAAALVGVLVLGETVLQLWLGRGYLPEMAPVLRLLVLGVAMSCVTQVNYMVLIVAGAERAAAHLQFIMLALTLVGTALGVHWFGVTGAAGVFALRLMADSLIVRHLVVARGRSASGVAMPALLAWGALLTTLWALREFAIG